MRVQDFRHFLPAICGLRPQTTFRRPRVRVFTPAAVLAPVAIPSFFPPEVLDLTYLFLFFRKTFFLVDSCCQRFHFFFCKFPDHLQE